MRVMMAMLRLIALMGHTRSKRTVAYDYDLNPLADLGVFWHAVYSLLTYITILAWAG